MIPLMQQCIETRMYDLMQTATEGEYTRLILEWINTKSDDERALYCYEVIRAIKLCNILRKMDPPHNTALTNFIQPLLDYTKAIEKFVSSSEFWQLAEMDGKIEEQKACLSKILDSTELDTLFNRRINISFMVAEYSDRIAQEDLCRDTKLALDDFQEKTRPDMLFEGNTDEAIHYLNLNDSQRIKSGMSYTNS